MKFDHTFIAIRQRTVLEIYDLALHVCRDYFAPLLLLLVVGLLPWIALDWLLVGWMIDEAYIDREGVLYSWLMFVLIVSQAQVGTAMMTHYLGQAMFIGKPNIGDSIKSVWKVKPAYYWVHYGLRMIGPIAFFAWLFRFAETEDGRGMSLFLMTILLVIGMLVRSFRPYATKIFILERAPWRASSESTITFGKRSRSLHSAGSGLFGRFVVSIIFGYFLVAAFFGMIYTLYSWLGFKVGLGYVERAVFWPLSWWLVAGFFSVVRFLSYIDLRIRQEGWEVELSLKAEAVRLQQGARA